MNIPLATNMVATHSEAAERALVDLRAAASARSLFKPEWTERAEGDLAAAERGTELWSR
jgi:hypothetical protein